jgi:hypothetical protein
MRIGDKVLPFRVSILRNGDVQYVDSDHWKGQWWVLCFLATLSDSLFRPSQADNLTRLGFPLYIVAPESDPCLSSIVSSEVGFTMLADPAGLVHRRFGVLRARRSKCHTFLLDPAGIVRVQLIHDARDIDRLINKPSEPVSNQRQVAGTI